LLRSLLRLLLLLGGTLLGLLLLLLLGRALLCLLLLLLLLCSRLFLRCPLLRGLLFRRAPCRLFRARSRKRRNRGECSEIQRCDDRHDCSSAHLSSLTLK
jgi:hypothetical protein